MVKDSPPRSPSFEDFEQLAHDEFGRIPAQYRLGVDGLRVLRPALPHPSLPDVYTLGECVTETFPSDFGSPDTTRSVVVLHYGSFFRLSRLDPEFDWEKELWETLTHELQHHLESLASDEALVRMDYAANENYKRYEGEEFDPFFHRHGVREDDWFRVEDEFFLELSWPDTPYISFDWRGNRYRVNVPESSADVLLLPIVNEINESDGVHLVLMKRTRSLGGLVRSLLRRHIVHEEREVTAELDTPGDRGTNGSAD